MPTDTKNSTANASRIGSASDAARTLNSDRPTTRPARKAPSAIDTPNTSADATAMPSASASTASVNSSRDCVARDLRQQPGDEPRPPTSNVKTVSADDLRPPRSPGVSAESARQSRPKTAGITTSTRTVKRSSTTSQPTAICPAGVCSSRLSESTRMRTTVLATDRPMPKTRPATNGQPKA